MEEFHFDPDIEERIRLDNERERANKERRLKLIPFDWKELPRIDWPYGEQHPKDFEGWKIKQRDGRELVVQRLHQEYIYSESLLGGLRYPTDYLLDAIERAEELFPYVESSPIILPPSLYWGRKVDLKDGEDKGYEWMTLPRVRCIAELFSNQPMKANNKPFSSALVIWFQDHYGLPNEQVKAQLEELDWPKHAQEWSP